MASRKNLLSIDYHYDDDSGVYGIGEIDFGISGNLDQYIEEYGYDGVKDIMSAIGYLSWAVQDSYYRNLKLTDQYQGKSNEKS